MVLDLKSGLFPSSTDSQLSGSIFELNSIGHTHSPFEPPITPTGSMIRLDSLSSSGKKSQHFDQKRESGKSRGQKDSNKVKRELKNLEHTHLKSPNQFTKPTLRHRLIQLREQAVKRDFRHLRRSGGPGWRN